MENSNKRIAINTVLLYVRMFLSIAIQLYTIPVVLRLLGASDYGLYNVIGGITVLFTFVSGSMASGAQRFFAYAIGKKDANELKRVFDTTNTIYIILGACLFVLVEVAGSWFVNTTLVVDPRRLTAANWAYQFSIVTFILNILSTPYNAVMIAREKMNMWAYVNIGSSILKLICILLLQLISDVDYLVVYALIIMGVEVFCRVFYQVYCTSNFEECRHFRFSFDKELGKGMFAYSGFNIIGALGGILKKQGLNIVMNLFFGTLLNVAHGIALQVSGVAEQLVGNVIMAARPQITKYYAVGHLSEMWKLTYRSGLLAYYLLMISGLILFLEMPTILNIWLHEVPEFTVEITRLLIISLMIDTTTSRLYCVFIAFNRIKKVQLFTASLGVINVPVAYLILKYLNTAPLIPYFVQIAFSLLIATSYLIVAKNVIQLNLKKFICEVISREIGLTLLIGYVSYSIITFLPESVWRLLITSILVVLFSAVLIPSIGVNKEDRMLLFQIINNKLKR